MSTNYKTDEYIIATQWNSIHIKMKLKNAELKKSRRKKTHSYVNFHLHDSKAYKIAMLFSNKYSAKLERQASTQDNDYL